MLHSSGECKPEKKKTLKTGKDKLLVMCNYCEKCCFYYIVVCIIVSWLHVITNMITIMNCDWKAM